MKNEMPAGWKDMRECRKMLYCLTETDRIRLTDLMKEMAEALEGAADMITSEYCSHDQPHETYENCYASKQYAVLNKFRNWK